MHWDHEPRQIEDENENEDEIRRFVESLVSLLRMHWDHEPFVKPEMRKCLVINEGIRRFMESFLVLPDLLTGHELGLLTSSATIGE